jgi:hypothetical protein
MERPSERADELNGANIPSISNCFPVLQTLQHQREAEAAMQVDAVLVRLCRRLRQSQDDNPDFALIAPQNWETFNRERRMRRKMVRCIAALPATSRIGLRAKALALHALLDDGGGDLPEGAKAPDLLAWSLIQDILSE